MKVGLNFTSNIIDASSPRVSSFVFFNETFSGSLGWTTEFGHFLQPDCSFQEWLCTSSTETNDFVHLRCSLGYLFNCSHSEGMGEVLFSQVSVCLQGGIPICWRCTPIHRWRGYDPIHWLERTSIHWQRIPQPDHDRGPPAQNWMGVPQWEGTAEEYLIDGGRGMHLFIVKRSPFVLFLFWICNQVNSSN